MLALALALGLCSPGFIGLQRSPSVHGCGRCCRASAQTLRARLRPMLPAPRMAAPDEEEEAAPRTGKSEVFGEMSAEEQAAFLRQLDDACAAAGVGQSARFRGLLEAMAEGEGTEWRVLSTGAVLVDAPGVHDDNSARDAVVKAHLKDADAVWIVSNIVRAVNDKTAKDMLGEQFKRQ